MGLSLKRTEPQHDMVWIAAGTFMMGSERHYPEEAPAHQVSVDGFWIDPRTVTNDEFKQFVRETGYVTLAEKPAKPEDYPGAEPELLEPSSSGSGRPTGSRPTTRSRNPAARSTIRAAAIATTASIRATRSSGSRAGS